MSLGSQVLEDDFQVCSHNLATSGLKSVRVDLEYQGRYPAKILAFLANQSLGNLSTRVSDPEGVDQTLWNGRVSITLAKVKLLEPLKGSERKRVAITLVAGNGKPSDDLVDLVHLLSLLQLSGEPVRFSFDSQSPVLFEESEDLGHSEAQGESIAARHGLDLEI